MSNILVSNAAELSAALKKAVGGETIVLKAGDYGNVTFSNLNPAKNVNIVSQPYSRAHFDSVVLQNSSNLAFSFLDVGSKLNAPDAMGKVAFGIGSSRNIVLMNMNFHGNGDGDPTNDPAGIRIRYSSGVTVSDSTFTELHRAVIANSSDHTSVLRNSVKNMSEDGFNFADVQDIRIADNVIGDFSKILAGQHPDGIQFQTAGTTHASKNIVIENNVIMQGGGQVIQGIFLGNEINLPYENVRISNNLVYTQQYHGISVGTANGVTIDHNTTLSKAGDAAYSWIYLNKVANAVLDHNVAESYVYKDSTVSSAVGNIDVRANPGVASSLPGMAGLLPAPGDLVLPGAGYQEQLSGPATPGPVGAALTVLLVGGAKTVEEIAHPAMVLKAQPIPIPVSEPGFHAAIHIAPEVHSARWLFSDHWAIA